MKTCPACGNTLHRATLHVDTAYGVHVPWYKPLVPRFRCGSCGAVLRVQQHWIVWPIFAALCVALFFAHSWLKAVGGIWATVTWVVLMTAFAVSGAALHRLFGKYVRVDRP